MLIYILYITVFAVNAYISSYICGHHLCNIYPTTISHHHTFPYVYYRDNVVHRTDLSCLQARLHIMHSHIVMMDTPQDPWTHQKHDYHHHHPHQMDTPHGVVMDSVIVYDLFFVYHCFYGPHS